MRCDMKFRIKKENGIYFAEYKKWFFWWFVSDSVSYDINKTRDACKKFETTKIIERFEL